MNRFALTTAIALGLAAPALASDQLAQQAGVQPGVYTTSELVQLIDAREDQDYGRVRAIESRAADANAGESRTSPGHVQLARSLNVDPADYSTSALAALSEAREDEDWPRVRFLEETAGNAGDMTATFSTRNPQLSAGHVQLARSLGVDPADFSTAELVQLNDAYDTHDRSRVRQILQQAGT